MSSINAKQQDLLKRAVDKQELRPFLFKNAKKLDWLEAFIESGFFKPEDNPKPIPAKEEGYMNIPPWPAVLYLINIKEKLHDTENLKYAEIILKIIRDCTNYAIKNQYGNYRTWWKFAKIIKFIPIELITKKDINGIISHWLKDKYSSDMILMELGESWLPLLLEENTPHAKEVALELLKQLYQVDFTMKKKISKEDKNAFFIADKRTWHIIKVTEKHAIQIGKVIGEAGVLFFIKQLHCVLKELENDEMSYFWRPAIEDHDQNKEHYRPVEDILIQALRDCLLGSIENDSTNFKVLANSLFESEYETIKRVGIYFVTINRELFASYTDTVLNKQYFTNNFRHETWIFLEKYFSRFNSVQKDKFKTIIDSIAKRDKTDENDNKYNAYRKQIWLMAVKNSGDSDFENLYNETEKITETVPENPAFAYYSTGVRRVEDKSAYTPEYLSALSIDDLIETLNSYEPPDEFGFEEPTLEGLTKSFKDAVKLEPIKYYNEFDRLKGLKLPFLYNLIGAYHVLWIEKNEQLPWDTIWEALFRFCFEIIKNPDYWKNENAVEIGRYDYNRDWITGEIASLIESGVRADDHAFSTKLIPQAKEIIVEILKHKEGREYEQDSDAMSIAINSPRGKTLEALINLALRELRTTPKEEGKHVLVWETYQSIFESELHLADEKIYEFATLLPRNIPQFMYMSLDWVTSNLHKIFNQNNYQQWLCAMQGYSYVCNIHKLIYKHLKVHGDFIKALDDDNLKEQVRERVLHYIAVVYFGNDEKMSDSKSLISVLFQRNQFEELRQLSWIIRTFRSEKDDNLKTKIIPLWELFLKIIDTNTKEGKLLAANLCMWIEYIDELSENHMQLLKSIVPYANESHNAYIVIENLARLSVKFPLQSAELWLEMFKGCIIDYQKEDIEKLFQNIFKAGSEGRNKAKEINDLYLIKGCEITYKTFQELDKKVIVKKA